MDFYRIVTKEQKDGSLQLRPDWKVGNTVDLMTRGGAFYAVWDEEKQLWSTNIYDVVRLVDNDVARYAAELEKQNNVPYKTLRLEDNSTKLWQEFNTYIRNSGNNARNLDERLTFANTEVTKDDYASRRLPYSLYEGDHSAWDSLVGTLYNEEERAKIEWAIGAVISGDSKSIQKFMVFYGPPGSGKSTILNIIEQLFSGYTSVFDARELAGNNNSFATSAFKSNPLVAIQHDGDLSRIYDNTKLNSIVAHEIMPMNEKYQKVVEMRVNAFLFMGTNLPVKITDAKAGIIRRLIDIVPTGQTIDHDLYHDLMERIPFELGAIAKHCLDRYLAMGRNYYSGYRPTEMMLQTDVFFNYVEAHMDVFKDGDGVSLQRAWSLYKEFCNETGIDKMLPQYKFREELKNYFYGFDNRTTVDGKLVRSYYRGFKGLEPSPPVTETPVKPEGVYEIALTSGPSIFDEVFSSQPAQVANEMGVPSMKWVSSVTKLSDIDTHELHYVKVPESHIVIDFDLKDENGEKSLALNLEEASKWPPTYAETSKSGKGIHLHYTYMGDVALLSSKFSDGIEVQTLRGDASLRRKLTSCNNIQIMPLMDGTLPKKEKSMIGHKSIQSEKGLRAAIERNLRKEHHPSTKSSVDFIHHILEEAYDSGLSYNVEDMRRVIYTFALNSTNQSAQAVKVVQTMKFVGKSEIQAIEEVDETPVVFYDVEVFSNLFVVCWKAHGIDGVASMINPTPEEIEPLLKKKLVGFNNRRYDNHILYARYLGESNEELYSRSQRLINGGNDRSGYIGGAYDLSYADIYDFSSIKQGLKKFEIQLGIHHQELDLPWDKPVKDEDIAKVVSYCQNDVIATEAVYNDRAQDLAARKILASLSGLTVNHTTQNHTAKIIFGEDKNPQSHFVYTNLDERFPGYVFDGKESTYRGEVTGEGGYVYAKPGMYENVIELDVASMHPTSIVELNLFGKYTGRFNDLLEARLAIKARDYDRAGGLLDGKLTPFLTDNDKDSDQLSYALKIVINTVYGLTSAKFPNSFLDDRNKDNIVAKRGALFMIDLKNYVSDLGYDVVHIKTDSIKIPVGDGDPDEITRLVSNFGKEYGYAFEVDHIYEKFCLVNDAVYIANDGKDWVAVGAQFQHPYVYKSLFSKETLGFEDWCETKNVVQGAMYLDFESSDDPETWIHVGRTGVFMPVLNGGANLWRVKEDRKYAVTGTKGHKWITRDMARVRESEKDLIVDKKYFDDLVESAKKSIAEQAEKSGYTLDWFVSCF